MMSVPGCLHRAARWGGRRTMATTSTELFDMRLKKLPNRDILRIKHQDIRWSLKDFKKHTDAFAFGLSALGCRPGHTVAAILGNDVEHAVLLYAAARLGVVVAPFDDSVASKSQIESAIAETQCRVVLFGRSAALGDGINETINEVLPCLKEQQLKVIPAVRDERFPHLRHVMSTDYKKINSGILNFRNMLMYNTCMRSPIARAREFVKPDSPLVKSVSVLGSAPSLTHGDIAGKAAKAAVDHGITGEDKMFLASRSSVDLAIGLAVAVEKMCPLVIPSQTTEDSQLYDVEECTKRIDTFA